MAEHHGTHWHWRTDPQGICWLTLDQADASANTLGRAVLAELNEQLAAIQALYPRGVIVRSAKTSGFIAGADINEFTRFESREHAHALVRQGQAVLARLAALPCPTVAAINGFALGGGLELALACDYRISADGYKPVLGFPEVQLGIHPGFGGTVRSVQLLGLPAAMDLMLTGRSLRPGAARKLGLVDRVVASDDLDQAAVALIQRPPPLRRAPWYLRPLNWLPPVRNLLARRLEARVARRARREHYPAPYAIVELWRRHGASGDRAYQAEADSIATLFETPTAQNLVRVFFLRERLRKLGGDAGPPIRRVHVVGAGRMGGDIAAWCVTRGLTVSLQDREAKYVQPALERGRVLFAKRLRGPGEAEAAAERLLVDVEAAQVPAADLVIEAIFEDAQAKRDLYALLEPRLKADALLATNTSSLRLEDLGSELADPTRLVGLHFFNPVAKLPLVEVIQSEQTSAAVLGRALAFVAQIGKLPLPCRSAPGFVVNRLLAPYMMEAMLAHDEGLSFETIDLAAEAFGMPVGPVELADRVGLDVACHVAEILGAAFGLPVPASLKAKVDAGELGTKTGSGFYRYVEDKAQKATEVPPAPEDLQDRLILPMLNEAVACLADKVVADADLLDAGIIFGTGFAPFTGGPIHYARQRGIEAVVDRLQELAATYGERFAPHGGWEMLRAEL